MSATRHELEVQYRRVISQDWLRVFQAEAKRAETTTAHLLALGSRETNLKNIKGDKRNGIYHGFGILQVDIGTDPDWCNDWRDTDPIDGGVHRGVGIYLAKNRQVQGSVGKRVTMRGRPFIGRDVEPDDLRRIATAAYNCGLWAYYHFSRGEHVDSTTTGQEYSRDVYDRAIEFADMLERDDRCLNAVAIELDMQGKYARREDQNRFGHLVVDNRLKAPMAASQEDESELARVDYHQDSAVEPVNNDLPVTEPSDAGYVKPRESASDSAADPTTPGQQPTDPPQQATGFSPEKFAAYVPQINTAKSWIKWLGGLTTLGTAGSVAMGLPLWLQIGMFSIVVMLIAGAIVIFVKYHDRVFAYITAMNTLLANPAMHDPNVEGAPPA